MSRAVLLFLQDYRDQRLRDAIGAFLGGSLTAQQEAEARGRCLLADELVALEFEHILAFYGFVPKPPAETERG